MKFCSNCGKENKDSSKFCDFCGSPLKNETKKINSVSGHADKYITKFKGFSTRKKILTLLVICCVGLLIIGVIGGILSPDKNTENRSESNSNNNSSSEAFLTYMNITPSDSDFQVTVNGFSFIIPKGYGEYEQHREDGKINSVKGFVSESYFRQYMDTNSNQISINVLTNYGDISIDNFKESGDIHKTINGHYGLFNSKDGSVYFNYIDNGCMIMLSAPDEATLNKMLS